MVRTKRGWRVKVTSSLLLCLGLCLLCITATSALEDAFEVQETTIAELHEALFTGSTTCRAIVSSFLARIEEFNPRINAIISLNPHALDVADQLDERVATSFPQNVNVTALGALFCVPVLLKDNFDAVGMSTTAGGRALAGNTPAEDAPTVKALIDAGAVILGKTNLHEMALEGLTVSSLGGQTLNPYDLTRTPGGSSGGSGAAVAANFAVLATGTDTMNSLRNPASANSLFSFRPTRGLISRAGVVPVSFTQDTVGAMARNPQDLAVALTVMASVGVDPRDNVTMLAPPEARHRDYTADLQAGGSLKGLRLGVLNGFFNHTPSAEATPVNEVMAGVMAKLTAAGVEIVNITDPLYDSLAIAKLDVQAFEFREMLDAYLSSTASSTTPSNTPPSNTSTTHTTSNTHSRTRPPTTFHDLYFSSTHDFLVIPSQHHLIHRASNLSTSDPTYLSTLQRIQDLTRALDATFTSRSPNNTHFPLDALIYPQQKTLVVPVNSPSQSNRNGILAALTGYPVVCIPAGFSPPPYSVDAPVGVPIGMEILGRPWSEGRLLEIARLVGEVVMPVRVVPPFVNGSVEGRGYDGVPVVVPGGIMGGGWEGVYPMGML
ncbi:amidase signature domain-containing protein [Dichotomopilus funicola]|uniref:Amidase signature domain-containing protein n=1 Tax=Dichotomopilus funicola TaxID=1934379 RepID=A0AAN6V5W2_9PEZI|nr:amidase signature domain-containing protein [Dichotomopilus funicola]